MNLRIHLRGFVDNLGAIRNCLIIFSLIFSFGLPTICDSLVMPSEYIASEREVMSDLEALSHLLKILSSDSYLSPSGDFEDEFYAPSLHSTPEPFDLYKFLQSKRKLNNLQFPLAMVYVNFM